MKNDQFSQPSKETFSLTSKEVPGEFPDEIGPGDPPLVFRHITVSGVSPNFDSIEYPWYWTRLNHPLLNGNPNAFVFVTPVGMIEIDEESHEARMRHNNHAVGVVYRNNSQRWYIYNLDLEAMAVGAVFNIVIGQR